MAVPTALLLEAAVALVQAVARAMAAGRTDVSEADVDAALDRIAASDARLSDAIARARARAAGGS